MPYVVQSVQGLYEDADREGRDASGADLVADFLSQAEAAGFRLAGVVPDHQLWDVDGQPAGRHASLLLLHRSEPL